MTSKRLSLWLVLTILLAMIVACGAEPMPTSPPPTEAVQVLTETPLPPTNTPVVPADTPLAPMDTPSPTPAPIPVFEEADCPFELPKGEVDGRTVECGYLEVPEDRTDPGTATLRLAVAIFHPDGDPEPDPVIYLEGGPGGSALEFARLSFETLSAPVFAANRDLILFDQRGVGLSEPVLDCPALTQLGIELLDNEIGGEELTYQEMDDLYLETALACGEELRGIADLSDYDSDASAADVEDLRRALGYDQVNLWGISYGTRLALEVMRDYPDGVRSVVLDSVVPPDVDPQVEGPANVDRALALLLDSCATDEGCNAAYPELRTVLFDTVDRLNESPAAFPVTDALTGEVYDAVMNGDDMLGLLAQSLYQTDVIPLLPQIIYDASDGSYGLLARIAGSRLAVREGMSDGTQFSVQCNEEVSFSSATAFEAALAEHPELEGLYASADGEPATFALCDGWGAGQADASANEPVTSAVPALVMSGEFDPVTPPDWGRRAAETLENGAFFEYPGEGHGVSPGDGCAAEMMTAFLEDPDAVPEDACMVEMGPPQFALPAGATIEFEPFANEEMDISGVIPAGWEDQGNGVYLRGASSLDATVLIAQGAEVSADEVLGLYADAMELEDPLESVGERKANGMTWTLYAIDFQGQPTDIALTEQYGQALIVLLMSEPGEREMMLESVFFPVVDALVPLAQPAANVVRDFKEALQTADYARAYELCDADLQEELGSVEDTGV
jgi:pimeloyl-ACP methyl ester carboxylesterase